MEDEVEELEKKNRMPCVILALLVCVLLVMALALVMVYISKGNSQE